MSHLVDGSLIAASVSWGGFKWTGSFTTVDLVAASTNALNGALLARRPDLTMETIEAYLHNLFRVQPDFVYSVSRDFARSCQTPMLVMPDDTPGHPYQVSMDIAALAPKADVTVYPWREHKDLWVKTVQQVRDFLKAHQPVAAAR